MLADFQATIELLTLAFAATFGGFLLFQPRGNPFANRLLSALMFIVAMENINYLMHAEQWVLQYPWLANTSNNFGILLGTCLYFYTRAMTDRNFRFNTRHLVHFTPFILFLTYNLTLYHSLGSDAQRALLKGGASTWTEYAWTIMLLGHATIFGYIVASLALLKHNSIKIRRVLSDVEPYTLSWLNAVIAVFLMIWLIRISKIPLLLWVNGQTLIPWIGLLQSLLIFSAVLTLLFKALQQHPVFSEQLSELAELEPTSQSQVTASLAAEQQRDVTHIQHILTEQKLWRQPSLTLADLANAAQLPAKQVSSLLNDDLNKNFFEFINEHRCLDAAKQLTQSEQAILDIAFYTGFNSKTAFNRAFKKHFGKTPSQYRNSTTD